MSELSLALYTRHGCHLCDALLAELRPYLERRPVQLELIDIDSDPQLIKRYGADVPVLQSEAGEICRHRLDHDALQAYLNSRSA